MTKEEEEESSFRITDKRQFREDGDRRESIEDETPPTEQAQPESPSPASSAEAGAAPVVGEAPPGTQPPIDFPSYILSYYTQGLVLLGEVPNPYSNKKEEDLQASKHTIDILGLLEEKTKGNLSEEEQKLLESVLYELRMKFMAKTSKIKL